MQVRTGEPGKGKKKPRLVSTICHAQTLWNFSLLSDFLSLLPPTNFPRCSLRQERSMETNKYLYRCDRYRSLHVWAFFQKRKKEICVDSPWLERGIVEATTPATHDAGGVGVSQIQIRSRCSRDTHPPCLRSDTRADLHVRGRVASPRLAAVVVSSLIPSRFLSLRFP